MEEQRRPRGGRGRSRAEGSERTERVERGERRERKDSPVTRRVSFIQLMSWEAGYASSGRERIEQLGAAFCKDFEIEDDRLSKAPNIVARQIIFGRYVTTDTRYHQNAHSSVEDLADLYPVDQNTAGSVLPATPA